MQDQLLYEVVEGIVGKTGHAIVNLLKNRRNVDEFKIANKLNITINQARNMLYKLYEHDIVNFIRKKDKRKGWYIYYWTLNTRKSLEHLLTIKKREMQQLFSLLKSRTSKRFYQCKGCDIELSEETAMNHEFLCPECGNLLQISETDERVNEINRGINKIRGQINIIESELKMIGERDTIKHEKKASKLAKRKKRRKKGAGR